MQQATGGIPGDDVVERPEVTKERAFGDPCARGHLGDRRVVATFTEQFDEGLVDRTFAALDAFVPAVLFFGGLGLRCVTRRVVGVVGHGHRLMR